MQLQLLQGTPASLEVALQGVTEQSHLVQVVFNGVDLGTMSFAQYGSSGGDVHGAGHALVNGNNTLELTSLGGAADVSLVDTIRLTYAHSYAADNNALAVSIDSEETKRVSGFHE